MKPRKPLPRATKPIKRSWIKNRITKRKKALLAKTQGALDLYFSGSFISICQICAKEMSRKEATPAHLYKRHHGRHEPNEILAAHLKCHTWLDNGAHMERIERARESGVSCASKGNILWMWPEYTSLIAWIHYGYDHLGGALPRHRIGGINERKQQ